MNTEAYVLTGSGLPLSARTATSGGGALAQRYAFMQSGHRPSVVTQIKVAFPAVDLSALVPQAEEETVTPPQAPWHATRSPSKAESVAMNPIGRSTPPASLQSLQRTVVVKEPGAEQIVVHMGRDEQSLATSSAVNRAEPILLEQAFGPADILHPEAEPIREISERHLAEAPSPALINDSKSETPAPMRQVERVLETVHHTHERLRPIKAMQDRAPVTETSNVKTELSHEAPVRMQIAPLMVERVSQFEEHVRTVAMGIIEREVRILEAAATPPSPILAALAAASSTTTERGIRIGSVHVTVRAPQSSASSTPLPSPAPRAVSPAVAPRPAYRSAWLAARKRQD